MTTNHRSWKAEIITNAEGEWVSNRLRFATLDETMSYVHDLAERWTMVTDARASTSNDPVSHRYIDHQLLAVVPFLIPCAQDDNAKTADVA